MSLFYTTLSCILQRNNPYEVIKMFDNRNNAIVVRKHRRPGLRPFYFSSDFDEVFEGFRDEMEKWVRNPWAVMERSPMLRTYHRQNMMPMDFRDAGDSYLLSVELPGVNREDVKVRMDDDILTLKVEGKEEKEKVEGREEKEENFLMKERSTYDCERCLRLPSEVMADDIKARMENGILNITIPKAVPQEKEVKEITVE